MINEEGLRDWFGKSKSKDGKSGWVNVVTGGTCASDEPGEGTPKCVSSAKRASMSKKERLSAQRRKKAADPGQQQKSGAAKPTYVPTDKPKKKKMKESTIHEADYWHPDPKIDRAYGGEAKARHREDGPQHSSSGSSVKKDDSKKLRPGESYMDFAKRSGYKSTPAKKKSLLGRLGLKKEEVSVEEVNEAKDKPGKGSGKKDACYHKVKSRYSVWPSAYASGALVKCRKKGAANWGNKSEGMEEFYNLPELTETQIAALKYAGYEVEVIDEACWKGYEKKGMKTMFGKRYPNCVKKEETEVTGGILIQDKEDYKPLEIETVDVIKPEPMKGISEATRVKAQTGNMYQVIFGWRGKMMMVKLFFPEASVPNRQKVADALNKMYPGSQLRSYSHSVVDYDDPYINVGEETDYNQEVKDRMDSDDKRKRTQMRNKHRASHLRQNRSLRAEHSDWRSELEEGKGMEGMTQKGGHKRPTDQGAGLTKKGVEKYRRQNPGSKLQTAVTTPPSKLKPGSKAAKRRKSFCARSRGWTGERGKAARRRWNC